MPWVTFERDFFWTPPGVKNWARLYRKGQTYLVTSDCAARALERKVARVVERPKEAKR